MSIEDVLCENVIRKHRNQIERDKETLARSLKPGVYVLVVLPGHLAIMHPHDGFLFPAETEQQLLAPFNRYQNVKGKTMAEYQSYIDERKALMKISNVTDVNDVMTSAGGK